MARVGLHLTDRCQLDCDHCLRDPGRDPVDLALAVIDAVLRDASRAYGIRRASMTGGEPTLHPRFPEILDLVVSHGMVWDMVTNGRRFDRLAGWLDEAPARLTACSSVAFSIDGATDATHDGIRGSGQRREVLSAMAVCVAMGIPFATATTLHARNVSEIEAIARECAALGARSVRFAMMQPTGTHLDEGLRLDPAEWLEAHARIQRLAAEGLPVVAAEGWPTSKAELCGPLRGETLHVDHHGRLTMCCLHSGLPSDGVDSTIAGDASDGLEGAMAGLAVIQEAAIAQATALSEAGSWSGFRCNTCLGQHGRPHWTDQGVGGAPAQRERWRNGSDRATPTKRSLRVSQ